MGKIIRTQSAGRRGPLPRKRLKVCAWVRHQIAFGKLKPGERLPDRTWFMRRFSLGNLPVQQAFDELRADGLIRSVPGHGTCVATDLPFQGRYLLVVRANPLNAGSYLFASALQRAAADVAERRGLTFEVLNLADADCDTVAYAEMLEAVRRQHYAGVFLQGVTEVSDNLNVLTNVDDVPIAFPGQRSHLTQGNLARPLSSDAVSRAEAEFRRHFASCCEKGCHRIALFVSWGPKGDSEAYFRELARECGLEIVCGGYHFFHMDYWFEEAFVRLTELFFCSDGGREADAIVLSDDNMLVPFANAHRKVFGRSGDKRHFVSCHCNAPLYPATDFPAVYHGFDLVATLDSFVNYAEDCRGGIRSPRQPVFAAM